MNDKGRQPPRPAALNTRCLPSRNPTRARTCRVARPCWTPAAAGCAAGATCCARRRACAVAVQHDRGQLLSAALLSAGAVSLMLKGFAWEELLPARREF